MSAQEISDAVERQISAETMAASLLTTPREGQKLSHGGKPYTTIREGLAFILVPEAAGKEKESSPKEPDPGKQSVFYNPIQQYNRDLSVLAIKAFGEEYLSDKSYIRGKRIEALSKKSVEKSKKRKRSDLEASSDDTVNQETTKKLAKNGQNGVSLDKDNNDPVANAAISSPPQTSLDPPTKSISPETVDTSKSKQNSESSIAHTQNEYKATFTILDALSATGLRALRYAHEIPFVTSVVANDLLPQATASIKLNVQHNRLEEKIRTNSSDAIAYMYGIAAGIHKNEPNAGKFDVIDLDPYGTAAPFLDAALHSLRDGGLLCVTCTDAGVFASVGYSEKTYSLYGGLPLKGPHSHEAGLRLILHAIATSAARHGLAIEPLLSLSIDFYARLFVRVKKSPVQVKFLAGKTMIVYNCDSGCGAWTTQLLGRNKEAKDRNGGKIYKHGLSQGPTAHPTCQHCGFKSHMAGPMYAGPLHSKPFITRILGSLPGLDHKTYATVDRIEGMLSTALDELLPVSSDIENASNSNNSLEFDHARLDHTPFYFILNAISKVIHCITPHENAFRGALVHLGYRVTRSHIKPGTIKTDAPWEVIWEVMREWVRQKAPLKEGALREGTAGWAIMHPGSQTPKSLSNLNGNKATATDSGTPAEPNPADCPADHKITGGILDGKTIAFDEKLGKNSDGKRLVRYPQNPRANWGPMSRAKGGE
ncbi:MAG: RNA methyltransferase tRNA(m5U54)methyltransferase [Trizodia sp. TS-e1964]|nr:MAG: RNA methyltransferase tRNA(m5U54)methyltransferase [Trizodia sp. TS-e1964]